MSFPPHRDRTRDCTVNGPAEKVSSYFVWTLLFSVPFYVWGLLWPLHSLPYGLPVSATMILVPACVATWRRFREQGESGVWALWGRLAELWHIGRMRWLSVALLAMPLATGLAYLMMRQFGMPLPAQASVPLAKLPLMFVVYALAAIPEEIGWTAYATEPLQRRFGVLRAGLKIGAVWALWHVIPWWLVEGHTLGWVAGQFTCTMLMRLAMGWLYARAGRSLGLAVVFHAMSNVAYSSFPNAGSHYDPGVVAAALALLLLMALLMRKLMNVSAPI